MKRENFPNFATFNAQGQPQFNAQLFLTYFANVQQPQEITQNIKVIEDNVAALVRQPQSEHYVVQLVKMLCEFFKKVNMAELLSLIRTAVNPDVKFEAASKNNGNDLSMQNIRNAISSEPIALPYGPEPAIGPQLGPVVAVYSSDNVGQQNQTDARRYLQEDNEHLNEFLQSRIRFVKRQGISIFFTQMAELICSELIDPYFTDNFLNFPLNISIGMLNLLEYINPSLNSFYLLEIGIKVTQAFTIFIERPDSQQNMAVSQYKQFVGTFLNIVERWNGQPSFSVDAWNWDIGTRMIKLYIKSQVSQKKLFAIKNMSEMCRISAYGGLDIKPQKIKEFILDNYILGQVYQADNHPDVIKNGSQIFLYIAKDGLTQDLIDLLFNLVEKGNQNLSVFETLQRAEEVSIQNNRHYLLQKMVSLSRSNCFNDEAFLFLQKIIVLTPSMEIQECLRKILEIIKKNYVNLRQNYKMGLLKLYFETFVMAIQLGAFNQKNALVPLASILSNPSSNLYLKMILGYVQKLQVETSNQRYGDTCRKILQESIKKLFKQYRIQELKYEKQSFSEYLQVIWTLLQSYERVNEILGSRELGELIRIDNRFSTFIQHYSDQTQIEMIDSMLLRKNKTCHDLECIIKLYHLMNVQVRRQLAFKISEEYQRTENIEEKYQLAPEIIKMQVLSFESLFESILMVPSKLALINRLILARQILKRQDQRGVGQYPPFECLQTTCSVDARVLRFDPSYNCTECTLLVKSYQTVYEIVSKIVKIYEQSFQKTKIVINKNKIQLSQLKEKIGRYSNQNKLTIEVYETTECQWFSQAQLYDSDGCLKPEIVDALRDLFNKYSLREKLYRQGVAKVFRVAIGNQDIMPEDSKVHQIFSQYSNNGEYLTLQEWIHFFYQKGKENAPLVVSNLVSLGYHELFKTKKTFEDSFASSLKLRKEIVNQGSKYDILFQLYMKFCYSFQDETSKMLKDELMKTLNILPTNQNLLIKIKENSEDIFFAQKANQLYVWYLSKVLKSMYFGTLFEDPNEYLSWKAKFIQTKNLEFVKNAYNQFLKIALAQNTSRDIEPHHLVIEILQSLGKISRQNMKNIPILTNLNIDSVLPLLKSDIMPQFSSQDNFDVATYMEQVTMFCKRIFKTRVSSFIAENAMAHTVDKILKQVNTNPIHNFNLNSQMIFFHNENMRALFNNFYFLLSIAIPSIKQGYYNLHLSRVSKFQTCKQYFTVLSRILSLEEDERWYEELSQVLQNNIAEYLKHIQLDTFTRTDQFLLGCLKTLSDIKIFSPKTRIQSFTLRNLQNFLELHTSEEIRDVIYRMSLSFCDFESNFLVLSRIMQNLKLSGNSKVKGNNKMGIQNLGCTCYINAAIQQLEMIEPFRRGIIGTEVTGNQIDFFREFQNLIYQLTFGQREYIIPENFCLNYLDQNGKPVNIRQQQDSDEFLNKLFDRLQNRLKGTNQESLISKHFKGQGVNIISCDSCFQKKPRVENFYILTLEIKQLKTLKECLNKHNETEIISGYFCQNCDKKVESIQKFYRLKTLPSFFFIHLQRLVYNMNQNIYDKLQHIVNFPQELDLSEYLDQPSQNPIMYKLKGFVVHLGGAGGGHYYSIINCDGLWIKFDDTRIDEWKQSQQQEDIRRAYMLIYEQKTQCQEIRPLNSQDYFIGNKYLKHEVEEDNSSLKKEQIFIQPSFMKFIKQNFQKIGLPQQFRISLQDLQIPYHPDHQQLPQQINKSIKTAFEILLQFLKLEFKRKELNLGVDNHSRDHKEVNSSTLTQLQSVAVQILQCLHIQPQLFQYLLQEYLSEAEQNFMNKMHLHREKEVRQILKALLIKVVVILKQKLQQSFLSLVPQNEIIQKLLLKILNRLNVVGKQTSRALQFFVVINRLIDTDDRFGQWFQSNKVGPKLIHGILNGDSPLPNNTFDMSFFFLNCPNGRQIVTQVLIIIAKLVRFQRDLNIESQENKIQRQTYLHFQFYRQIFNQRLMVYNLPFIINTCSFNNLDFSQKVINFIIQTINRFNHSDEFIVNYIQVLFQLLMIQDGFQRRRLECLLGVPLPLKKYEIQGEQYSIKTNTDRFCRYQNALQIKGDEIIFSFLQLLYINRKTQSYFVFEGIKALLNLINKSQAVSAYIDHLPGPCPKYPNYTDWINKFIFDSRHQHIQDNRNMTIMKKEQLLGQIAKLIDRHEHVEEDSVQHISQRNLRHNSNNIPYNIKKITFYTPWTPVPLSFQQNLILSELVPQNMQNLQQSQFLQVEERILAGVSDQEEQKPQIIEYKIDVKCKIRLSFTSSFPYSLNFEKGIFQFAFPCVDNLTSFMVFEVLGGQMKRISNYRRENLSKKMDLEVPRQAENRHAENIPIELEFPTTTQYFDDINNAVNDAKMKEEIPPDVTIECPFCTFVSSSFASRCPSCDEEWGSQSW